MRAKIAMIGTGYVGLVTGACFAELGHDVICVDVDRRKIDLIRAGKLPIYEPGLDDLVKRNVEQNRLRFTTSVAEGARDRDAVFIAVGTPSEPQTGRADLRYVLAAAEEIAGAINQFTVVVTKSTVPVGTNRKVHSRVLSRLSDTKMVAVASNPEFLREGAAIRDFLEPDRVVVGCDDDRALEIMERIYAPLTSREVPLVKTDIETAEMIKYAANAFLAIKVSFINEVADLCEAINADVRDVATGIGLDNRIGTAFLRAGPGWGGSCFPKDTRALLSTARDLGMPARIVAAAIEANEKRKISMVARVRRACGGTLVDKQVGVLGLTFKGQTDDMRESPSLDILPALVAEGATVVAFDPSDSDETAKLLPEVVIVDSAIEAARNSDVLVVLTDWMIFKTYDLGELSAALRHAVMVDLRNLFDEDDVLAKGFQAYEGLGYAGKSLRPNDSSVQKLSVAGITPRD